MASKDPRVDAYIARSAEFARPILVRLRSLVHRACPAAEETIKWGMPFFLSDGAILCHMAAFKGHCAFGLWKAARVLGGRSKGQEAMGQFGRIGSLADLPSDDEIVVLLRKAAAVDRKTISAAARPARRKEAPAMPADFRSALKKNARARASFEAFSPAKRRDYIEWLNEAKRDETRRRRLETAIGWIEQGKSRNWKYETG
ncbi:MAG TPA: YdeI/OmpD-associated family protein [Thermoanaerobaculia bacterium]|nr:YdeI/OmpD-associated family protein [Thermoanaerobaculia bacterium]